MALTGWPPGPPAWPAGDVVGRLQAAATVAAAYGAAYGPGPCTDVGALLTDRAAWRGLARRGAVSAGGRCRILRAADGWVAVSLARPSDVELLPALVAGSPTGEPAAGAAALDGEAAGAAAWDGDGAGAWDVLARHARRTPAGALVARAQLLGVPAAALPARRPSPRAPWSVSVLGAARRPPPGPPARRLLVVDLSAMWAGPLCAHLLGRAGATVVTVEDPSRPDGAREGDPRLYRRLHHGQARAALDLSAPAGRRALADLVDRADVVVESSRPRALAALGLDPRRFCGSRPGRTWVSITGYGRTGARSNWVAFGDDAAVAGGLVAGDARHAPAFSADAVADPVTGLYAAVGALASIAAGGGRLVDCAMAVAAAYANAGPGCRRAHRVVPAGDGWVAAHRDGAPEVPAGRRPPGAAAARGAG